MGRHEKQVPQNYVEADFRTWIDRSRTNLGTDPARPELPAERSHRHDVLDTLVVEGLVAAYGMSVETVDQAQAGGRAPARRDRLDDPERLRM